MTNRAISIFNQLRPYSVGFDDVFDHFGRMFDDNLFDVKVLNYPPYNIVKIKDNQYNIEVASKQVMVKKILMLHMKTIC